MFRNFALVGGRGVAVWRLAGPGQRVEIEPFAGLTAEDAAALARDGEALKRFLGLTGATNAGL